jgi:hypothetical protein
VLSTGRRHSQRETNVDVERARPQITRVDAAFEHELDHVEPLFLGVWEPETRGLPGQASWWMSRSPVLTYRAISSSLVAITVAGQST